MHMLQEKVHAPYCQGNVVVFGENAGQQCVAMSLCALIYSKIRRITSVADTIQIMTVGYHLYSSLSLPTRQSMLMLTKLPEMVTVFERFFQLKRSKVVLVACMVMPELRGITTVCHLKYSRLYNTFILSVGIIGLDSHARDMYGNSHSHDTCVL